MNLLEPQDWTLPVSIAYGPGRLREIAAFCTRAGMNRPLIVTDRGSRELPFIADTLRHLREGGLSPAVHADISPNPRDVEITAGRAVFRAGGHDGLIAIGGGSGMDGGKAVALVANNAIDLWAFNYDVPPPDMSDQPPVPAADLHPYHGGHRGRDR